MAEIKKGLKYGITPTVILLGLTSLLTDLSSEIIVPIVPLFMASLGASALVIGILGGLNESVISIMKLISGYMTDKTGKRKKFIISGYSASAVTKLMMSFAKSWLFLLILRPIERIGKGMREPPRDAILAETTPKKVHGKIFGIHSAFDTAGAIIGSILASVFLFYGLKYDRIFIIAAIIAFASIIPLLFIKERRKKPKDISLKLGMKNLSKELKLLIFVSIIFAFANFSYMFFILRAQQYFPTFFAVMLYVLFNVSFEIFAIPSGIMADKIGKKRMIIYGFILFSFACLNFAFLSSMLFAILGFLTYGMSHAFILGNQRAMAADLSKNEIGTGLGAFHMSISLASLPAGIIAGMLWQFIAPEMTFIFGAVMSIAAAVIFIFMKFEKEKIKKEGILASK